MVIKLSEVIRRDCRMSSLNTAEYRTEFAHSFMLKLLVNYGVNYGGVAPSRDHIDRMFNVSVYIADKFIGGKG